MSPVFQGQDKSLSGSAGAHLWIVGIQKQHSSNILAGPHSVLQELSALGPVQVVLGFLRVVPYGLREVPLCCLELPEGHAQGCHELPGKMAAAGTKELKKN